MSELSERISAASETLLKSLAAWEAAETSATARQAVEGNVHELRRALAAVEIELVTSERGQTLKPIPIPPHRAAKRIETGETVAPQEPPAAPAPTPAPTESAAAAEADAAPKRRGRAPLSLNNSEK